jgi:hypothetical protein
MARSQHERDRNNYDDDYDDYDDCDDRDDYHTYRHRDTNNFP